MMLFNYDEGIKHMISLHATLNKQQPNGSFAIGNILIEYPGYKEIGDYRLKWKGKVLTHSDLVCAIYNFVTDENFNGVIAGLIDIYLNGLRSNTNIFKQEIKELIYWITLQEEINYPQPVCSGRKLPFQRFYEAALAKIKYCSLEDVLSRTNNHGVTRPKLFTDTGKTTPIFYN